MSNKLKNKVGDTLAGLHNVGNSTGKRGPVDPGVPAAKALLEQTGVLPSMERFLGTKERTFWTFQCVGWLGYALVRIFHGMTGGPLPPNYVTVIFLAICIGFPMTILMRYIYRQVRDKPLQLVLMTVLLVCSSLGLLFSLLETALIPYIFFEQPRTGFERFGNAMFEGTVLFAWSTIYFGYHYYRGFQEQQEQALKATAMAHQAQLKMLRYQLNPHFLFNTLNAISTLVLEKSETDANRMLTKLSSFLRYTLVNQPTQRVTLDQELHALGLYLDIEKVRFQDRLTLEFDISEKARTALIPSLILQPLVENAIKYAVAPSIDGGAVKLSAEVVGGRLMIVLSDNGPGIDDLTNIVSQTGSGVGIANTNERLQQIYGVDHSIQFRNMEAGGLGIFIEFPCEREKRT